MKSYSHKIISAALIALATALIILFAPSNNQVAKNGKSTTLEQKKKVVLVFRLTETDPFWKNYAAIMKTAAAELGMDFQHYSSDWNTIKMTNTIYSLAEQKNRPDAIAFDNFDSEKGAGFVQLLDKKNLPFLIVDSKFNSEEYKQYGLDKFKNLIGQLYVDDFDAGYRMTKELVKKVPRDKDGNIYLLAFAGHAATSTSRERVDGMKKAVSEDPTIKLLKIIPADWNKNLAKKRFIFYKKTTCPKVTAVWAANDQMALGAIEGAEELGLTPGKDIFFVGLDWTDSAIKSIKEGKLVGTMGGHFFVGGFASVVFYDYLNGVKFPEGQREWSYKMYFIDKSNLKKFETLLDKKTWPKLDFKTFSKKLNPNLKEYNFDILKLVNQLE